MTNWGGGWAVAFGPDGKSLLTGSYEGKAQLWDLASRQPRRPADGSFESSVVGGHSIRWQVGPDRMRR